MVKIAVLLTVFNRREKTLKCLECLYSQLPLEGYEVDVFLTNDGCTDGTPEAVARQFPEVHIIHADGNLYWNRGMYTAWEKAAQTKDYDFYLWLNDDTVIYPQTLMILLDTSKKFNDEGIIVGTTCDIGNASLITYGGRTEKKGLLLPTAIPQYCDFFNGNIVLIPLSVYNKVGINDPCFRHALGDFDYGLRANRLGVKSIIAPGVLGECEAHKSLPMWCNSSVPFNKRWRAFRSPLGNNPEEFFIYTLRHRGIVSACFHYITNHLRVISPWMWRK